MCERNRCRFCLCVFCVYFMDSGPALSNSCSFSLTEIPYLRLRSYHELWSRSWHGWFLEHGFLVWNFIYNDIFVDVLLRGWNSQRKLSRFLPNTITFVPNNFSQCFHCVLSIMRCAFGSWPRGATNPVQIHWNCATFPSLIPGKIAVFW